MKKYLIINPGSASRKYALYEGEKELAYMHIESEEGGNEISTVTAQGKKEKKNISAEDFDKSFEYTLNELIKAGLIASKEDIAVCGIRVVAPGNFFLQDKIINSEYKKLLKKAFEKAPLHIAPILEEIKKIRYAIGRIPLVGISDSAFHSSMMEKSKRYAIPSEDAEKFEIFRYGYHGISLRSIVSKMEKSGPIPENVIICHIGGGVSVTALKNGKSIDTTMGLTPLEGVVMATRVGDIDSGAVVYLSKVKKLKGKNLLQYLNKKCGLLGISGKSDDVRDLIKAENEGDNLSKLALDMYAYKIQKYIGAYAVALGGLDTIVFSGTVGERSFLMRERICKGLGFLGVEINSILNNTSDSIDVVLSSPESKVKVEVVKTDEMAQMAKDTAKFL